MTKPSSYARVTADTLNTDMCRQIINFLRTSARNDDLLSQDEVDSLIAAAKNLEDILKWQTPSTTSN